MKKTLSYILTIAFLLTLVLLAACDQQSQVPANQTATVVSNSGSLARVSESHIYVWDGAIQSEVKTGASSLPETIENRIKELATYKNYATQGRCHWQPTILPTLSASPTKAELAALFKAAAAEAASLGGYINSPSPSYC